LFGKALGGGFEKISAVLVDSTRYCSSFAEYYVSSFGNGELAAYVALTTLQVIENEKLCFRSARAGDYLQGRLNAIQRRYPGVIHSVRGKGLLQAISFNPDCAIGSILLRILFQTEKAGYLFAAWFLNRHRIRILPTLSAPDTLRIEPSAYFSRSETDRFCLALDELCRIIQEKRTYDLFSFLMDDDPFREGKELDPEPDHYSTVLEPPAAGAVKAAFIAHFVFPVKELRMLDPDLERASDTGLRIFFKRMQHLLEMKPVQIMATNLFNKKVHFSFYIIPLDSAELEFLHKSGKRRVVVSKIQEAVDLAAANGASIISLGGYTSILSNNGLSLAEPLRARVITGNTLTAASGLMHLRNIIKQSRVFNRRNAIAVIGSTGNIGSIIIRMLYEQEDICKELILISRSEKREMELISSLPGSMNRTIMVRSSTLLSEVRTADVIVICTNTNDPIIFPHHIAPDKKVLISDMSVPAAVNSETGDLPNVTMIPFASYVRLPEDCDVVISSYSPPGTVFCCAGEAILLALESCTLPLKGRIMPDAVKAITELASRHGLFHAIDSIKSFRTISV
jgi:predicted amino acid dehydrogenase